MLGGAFTAWLVLAAPSDAAEAASEPSSAAPLDPFTGSPQHREPRDESPVQGDLVDPFAEPSVPHAAAPGDARWLATLDLKDPFAPQAHEARRAAPPPKTGPDLADPFRHGARVPDDDDDPCPAPKASNGATVQRPDGVPAARCRRGRPHLRDPFA